MTTNPTPSLSSAALAQEFERLRAAYKARWLVKDTDAFHLFCFKYSDEISATLSSAVNPSNPDRGEPVAWQKYIPDIVENAMLTMWNYICDETKCHPLDIEHGKGKYLTFQRRHWARMTGEMVAKNIADLVAAPPVSAEREALEKALEAFADLQRRLMSYCNHANAGHMPSDAREFARRIILGFAAAYEQAGIAAPKIEPETAEEYRAALSSTDGRSAEPTNSGDQQ